MKIGRRQNIQMYSYPMIFFKVSFEIVGIPEEKLLKKVNTKKIYVLGFSSRQRFF